MVSPFSTTHRPPKPADARAGAAAGLRAAVFALLCVLAASAAAAESMDRSRLRSLVGSVLLVEAVSAKGRLQVGSAVVVAPRRAVTNCHVTRDAASVWIVQGALRRAASAQAADVARDLCVLQVDELDAPAVALGRSTGLAAGQPVAALGYTGGIGLQVSVGRVIALNTWQDARIVQADTGFTSGASGGGLFTDDAVLVGLLTFRLRGAKAHYYAVPVEWLRPLLDDARYEPLQPLSGRAFWEEEAAHQPYFLRAASLEQTGQWERLLLLAKRWSDESANDGEPWYARGLAEEGLGRLDAAVTALERSVSLRTDDARAWVRLGLVHLRAGHKAQAEQALAAVARRFPDAAQELIDALQKHAD